MQQLQQMQDKAKERPSSREIRTALQHSLSKIFNVHKNNVLKLWINIRKTSFPKKNFQEIESLLAFRVLLQQFQTFLYSRFSFDTDEGFMIRKYFIAYTKINVPLFHDKLVQHMESLRESIQERAKHKREYDRRMNDRMMQSKERKVNSSKALDAGLVVTESNETKSERHVSSSRSGKDTHSADADINSVNDKQPMAEVQLFVEHNIRANEQQHSELSESVYDTYLLEKVDRNTIPKSTDMSHREGEIDQNADAEKCQVSCPLLDPSSDNMTTKFLIQSFESENISLKRPLPNFKKIFQEWKHIVLTRNLISKSSFKRQTTGLLAENEKLNKENEHLKQTYKDLSDSIKKTSVQTKDHADSLIVQLN
ncbi:hypothetical protein Tco_0508218, partial [Tanacetum coccineum]